MSESESATYFYDKNGRLMKKLGAVLAPVDRLPPGLPLGLQSQPLPKLTTR